MMKVAVAGPIVPVAGLWWDAGAVIEVALMRMLMLGVLIMRVDLLLVEMMVRVVVIKRSGIGTDSIT